MHEEVDELWRWVRSARAARKKVRLATITLRELPKHKRSRLAKHGTWQFIAVIHSIVSFLGLLRVTYDYLGLCAMKSV